MTRFLVLLILTGVSPAWAQETPAVKGLPPLRVNSFLVEEAYTQEEGIVEHIGAFRFSRDGTSEYILTQEWPLFSAKHQISFALPLQRGVIASGRETGLGDVEVSYGYQLLGDDRSRLFVSPRLTARLPTGDEEHGRGGGAPGVEVSLPASFTLSQSVVAHWVSGVSYTPSAKNARGDEANVVGYDLGASLVWMTHPNFGLLLGASWEGAEEVDGARETSRSNGLFIAPGVRGTVALASGLQLAPGLAVPIGVGPSSGERAMWLFLSVEHPFRRPVQE